MWYGDVTSSDRIKLLVRIAGMFKLLKDLTRPPASLTVPSPAEHGTPTNPPYTPRQRGRSPSGGSAVASSSSGPGAPARGASLTRQDGSPKALRKAEEVDETDEDSLKVIKLLKVLDEAGSGDGGVMLIVEVSLSAVI